MVAAFLAAGGVSIAVGGAVDEGRADAGARPGAKGPSSLPAAGGRRDGAPALAEAVTEGRWCRPPADAGPAEPLWGHAEGLRVGLSPLSGPRGLLRIYAPYLGQPKGRMINFIAVEPTPSGHTRRGFSELERSALDGEQGKRFWSRDDAADFTPAPPERPARGVFAREGEVETLRVHILVEPFANGARPYLRVTFRSDRPHEVGLACFAAPGSQAMKTCILSATMGNYARLRRLHLDGRIVQAATLWPDFRGNGFTDHARFPLRDLPRTPSGDVLVASTPDERDPAAADYAPTVPRAWRYLGTPATQYWRCERPGKDLAVQVNARVTYWACHAPIPGGVSFENFELVAPFRDGQEVWFGVSPDPATVVSPRKRPP